ncbi:hypothetical protein CIHG_03452 [Coccidioides immitis H538.4]|uniref:Uncharacterized protein n=1 Tax=Coccidioides immitis H538.4 TaxID=396776 RepID=A0A0J8UF08_COCIT|nr:hypothetical protein CIHG_03452 [Coccidioides immitis H538.4]
MPRPSLVRAPLLARRRQQRIVMKIATNRDTDAGTDADVDTDADPDGVWLIVQDISKHPRRLVSPQSPGFPDLIPVQGTKQTPRYRYRSGGVTTQVNYSTVFHCYDCLSRQRMHEVPLQATPNRCD